MNESPSADRDDRLHKADGIVVGTVSDVRRKMDELVEQVNPEYFNYDDDGDLRLMPIEVLKQQVRRANPAAL